MIKIFASNTAEKSSKLLHAHLAKARRMGGRHVIIVPDRFALSAERNVMRELGVKGLFDVEVMSFTRLAKTVLSSSLKKSLSPEGAVMLMRRAIDRVKKDLTVYSRAAQTPGFAGEMFAVLGTVRNNDVSVAELERATERLTGLSQQKSQDIVRIFKEYDGLIKTDYEDMTSRLNTLADEIKESVDVPKISFYILEFATFTAVQKKIIVQLMKYAKDVNLAVVSERDRKNARTLMMRGEKDALLLCQKSGMEYELCYESDDLDFVRQKINSYLYSYERTSQENTEKVLLYAAKDLQDEIASATAFVRHLVVDKGYRFSDVAVVAPDEEYKRALVESFARFDLVAFADVKEPAISHPGARFILDYVRALRDGVSLRQALSVVKNPYFNKPASEVDKFENYCLRYSVDRVGLAKEFAFDFDGRDIAEGVRRELLRIMGARVSLPTTAGGFVALIREFLARTEWEARCASLMADQNQAGDVEGAEITAQIFDVVSGLLNEIDEIMGDVALGITEFLGIFESMLTEAKISLVPFYQDCVYVGDTKDSRYAGVKALLVLGASDGTIPAIKTESGILSETELAGYRAVDVNIEPTGVQAYREEKAVLAGLLAKPTERLYLSYSIGAGKEGKKPSSVMNELTALFDVKILGAKQFAQRYPEIYLHRFSTKAGAEHALLAMADNEHPEIRALVGMNDGRRPITRRKTAKIPEEKLFKRGTTKISQLETYFGCPFRHFLQYVLGLRERQEGMQAADLGTLVHAVLENFVAKCDFGKTDQECLDFGMGVAQQILDTQYPFIEKTTPAYRDLIYDVRIILTDVIERQRHTRFVPTFFEAKIGMDGEFDALNLEGLKLVGVVDRIDVYKDKYVSIIDYKSGSPSGKLNELYYGHKVQLYAYLSSVVKGGDYVPVGVFYYPVNTKYDTDSMQKHVLRGQALQDVELLGALDDTICAEPGKFVPIKIDKNGNPTGDVSAQDFENLTNYALDVSSQAIREMRDGYIAPSPGSDKACEWCPYSSMCDGAVAVRNTGKAVKPTDFAKEKGGDE